jgi:hypothetical protein
VNLWNTTPQAQALLAEAVLSPPKLINRPNRFNDEWIQATGKLATALRRLRNKAMEASLQAGDASGDHAEFKANCEMTVERAIEEAIAAAAGRRMAA